MDSDQHNLEQSQQIPRHQDVLPVNMLNFAVLINPIVESDHADHALAVEDYELVRNEGNDGEPLLDQYRENNERVRRLFVDAILDGTLYESEESFAEILQQAHALAAAHDVYNDPSKRRQLQASDHGVFRTGNLLNRRKNDAEEVALLAEAYNDPYALRFNAGEEGGMVSWTVQLDGIEEDASPREIAFLSDLNGEVEGYMFMYPESKFIESYIDEAFSCGRTFVEVLDDETPDTAMLVGLIAEQYRYLVTARPFSQINNSLFMNLANAQIKLLGLKGITHGKMDLVAQRFQSQSFKQYFFDRVQGKVK